MARRSPEYQKALEIWALEEFPSATDSFRRAVVAQADALHALMQAGRRYPTRVIESPGPPIDPGRKRD